MRLGPRVPPRLKGGLEPRARHGPPLADCAGPERHRRPARSGGVSRARGVKQGLIEYMQPRGTGMVYGRGVSYSSLRPWVYPTDSLRPWVYPTGQGTGYTSPGRVLGIPHRVGYWVCYTGQYGLCYTGQSGLCYTGQSGLGLSNTGSLG